MDKEVVVHIYNGILFSIKRNTFESVLTKWMNTEPIIQSEVSQKEKDNYVFIIIIILQYFILYDIMIMMIINDINLALMIIIYNISNIYYYLEYEYYNAYIQNLEK